MALQRRDPVEAKILLVDDEGDICEMMRDVLESEGYAMRVAGDGHEGLPAFFAEQPSMVILDILMPRMDGWTVLERIREVSEVPVIMLTALGQDHERVRGLLGGADDYLVKPVAMTELAARVDAIFRRVRGVSEHRQLYGDKALYMDFVRHEGFLNAEPVALSPREFRLLWALVTNPGVVLSQDRLLDLCWGEGEGGPENVCVYSGYLSKKLEADPRQPRLIETVREFGYWYRPAA